MRGLIPVGGQFVCQPGNIGMSVYQPAPFIVVFEQVGRGAIPDLVEHPGTQFGESQYKHKGQQDNQGVGDDTPRFALHGNSSCPPVAPGERSAHT